MSSFSLGLGSLAGSRPPLVSPRNLQTFPNLERPTYTHVGPGRGGYTRVEHYAYVGNGRGNFELAGIAENDPLVSEPECVVCFSCWPCMHTCAFVFGAVGTIVIATLVVLVVLGLLAGLGGEAGDNVTNLIHGICTSGGGAVLQWPLMATYCCEQVSVGCPVPSSSSTSTLSSSGITIIPTTSSMIIPTTSGVSTSSDIRLPTTTMITLPATSGIVISTSSDIVLPTSLGTTLPTIILPETTKQVLPPPGSLVTSTPDMFFQCLADQNIWTLFQIQWCCLHEGVGCSSTSAGIALVPTTPVPIVTGTISEVPYGTLSFVGSTEPSNQISTATIGKLVLVTSDALSVNGGQLSLQSPGVLSVAPAPGHLQLLAPAGDGTSGLSSPAPMALGPLRQAPEAAGALRLVG